MSRNYVVLVLLFLVCANAQGQRKISTSTGKITFTSNAQLEMIKASSDKVKGRIDPVTNQFAFSVVVKSFQGFNTQLQREHFNDNYLQSEQYPTATFSGKIIEEVDFSTNGTYEVRAKGNLDIHGQKQIRIIKARIIVKNGNVQIESEFSIPLADHNISIPKIVNQKIATVIEVTFSATMTAE